MIGNSINNFVPEFCGLTTQHVRTFDNAEFQYKMKDNWHLITKDCSNKYGISVVAQPANNNSMVSESTGSFNKNLFKSGEVEDL